METVKKTKLYLAAGVAPKEMLDGQVITTEGIFVEEIPPEAQLWIKSKQVLMGETTETASKESILEDKLTNASKELGELTAANEALNGKLADANTEILDLKKQLKSANKQLTDLKK